MRTFLVLGCSNSGTSLLTSLIGAHPHVAALCESMDMSERLVIGKPVAVNKLIVPGQIQMKRKNTLLVRAIKRFGLLKGYPRAAHSLEEYVAHGAKVIFVVRERSRNIQSMLNRTDIKWFFLWMGMRGRRITEKEATAWYDMALQIKEQLKPLTEVLEISFEALVLNTKDEMRRVFDFMQLPCDDDILNYVLDAGVKYNWMYRHDRVVREKAGAPELEQVPR